MSKDCKETLQTQMYPFTTDVTSLVKFSDRSNNFSRDMIVEKCPILQCGKILLKLKLPSVRLSRLKTRYLASYSSVDNSVCRHILIHG